MRYEFYPNPYFSESDLVSILEALERNTSAKIISWERVGDLQKQHVECLISLASMSKQPNTDTVEGLAKLFSVTPGFVCRALKHARPTPRERDFYFKLSNKKEG